MVGGGGTHSAGYLARQAPPIVNLTFALNYAAHGLDVTGYRVTNVAIHILAALVVFEADDGSSLGEMIVFERPTETAVIQLEPGRYWVGCISGAAGTDVERIPRSESPELYVSFEVYAEE